jgi:hypothetical protein
VNTVLSLLALDYPAGKLACYVSDDGCSPLTCYALREAAAFARQWMPFCRRRGVGCQGSLRQLLWPARAPHGRSTVLP